MAWIIDGHEDLAFNAVMLHRNLREPLAHIRQVEGESPAHGEGTAMVSLPTLRAADVRVVMGTLFEAPARAGHVSGYHTREEAHQQAMAQIEYYHALHAAGEVTLIRDRQNLEAVVEQQAPLPGLLILMEGADPLRTPDDLASFVECGVRIVGLSWRSTYYAGGTGEPGPLTKAGKILLHEMAARGITLDISHLAEEACWQALETFPGRVIASHANCRALVPGERQLSDDLIRAVAERDGVIGLVCYNRFICPGWQREHGKEAVSLADLAAHARHIADLVGVKHIALGSDFDGGIGREDTPKEIDTIADLPAFASTLQDSGFTQDEVAAILHGNWLRVLREVLP